MRRVLRVLQVRRALLDPQVLLGLMVPLALLDREDRQAFLVPRDLWAPLACLGRQGPLGLLALKVRRGLRVRQGLRVLLDLAAPAVLLVE